MAISYAAALAFLQSHGYPILFIALFFEGPIVTPMAGFAASLGYFNVYVVMVLSFLGNQIPDMLLFVAGKWSKRRFLARHGARFGLSAERISMIRRAVHRHGDRAIWIVKLTPFVSALSIMVMAAAGYSWKRFLVLSALINLLIAIVVVGLGYYFGLAYSSFARYVDWSVAAIIAVLVLTIIVPLLYARAAKRIAQSIEKK